MDSELFRRLEEIKQLNLLAIKKYLTVKEASMVTGFTERTIRQLCNDHKIAYSKPGGNIILIPRVSLDNWIERQIIPSVSDILNARS